MTSLISVLYVLAFLGLAFVLRRSFLKVWGGKTRSNEHFGELLARGAFAAVALLLWFAFGDSFLSWFLGPLFGPTDSAGADAVSFGSHPFVRIAHLFAYVPIFAAMAASAAIGFAQAGVTWVGWATRAAFLIAVGAAFYWRFEGVDFLVSRFV